MTGNKQQTIKDKKSFGQGKSLASFLSRNFRNLKSLTFVTALLILSLILPISSFAEDAIVLLKPSVQTIVEMQQAMKDLETRGVKIRHVFPPNTFFVTINPSLKASLESLPSISAVEFKKLDMSRFDRTQEMAIAIWNQNYFPGEKTKVESAETIEPFHDEVLIASDLPKTKGEKEEANRTYLEGYKLREKSLKEKYHYEKK